MLGWQSGGVYPRKRPLGGLRRVEDQNHGPLSGWLAERRLRKALPSGQRKRRTAQSRRPVGDSPPRPSDRQRSDDALPPPDACFSAEIEPAPDYLLTVPDEAAVADDVTAADEAQEA